MQSRASWRGAPGPPGRAGPPPPPPPPPPAGGGLGGWRGGGRGAAAGGDPPAWIVTGDLGLFHDMNGLAALREIGSPVRIVVLNNDGGGIFEFLPQATQIERQEFDALLGTPQGLDPARVAALYDLPHVRIGRLEQLATAARQGMVLIEIPVDRRLNVELHQRILEKVAEALGTVRRAP